MLTERELSAWLEGELSPEERRRVEAELDLDPQAARELAGQARLDAALRCALGKADSAERVKQSVLAVVRGEGESAIKRRILAETTPASRRPRWSRPRHPPVVDALIRLLPTPIPPAWASILALGFCLLAGLSIAMWRGSNNPAALAGGMELPNLIETGGRAWAPRPGETIRVAAAGSGAITFADGTVLHLDPGAEIVLLPALAPARRGGKQLRLLSGSLSAEVVKQPEGLPLLVETPHALATVVGTEFGLGVEPGRTELEVARGVVTLAEADGTRAVRVEEGEFAVASPSAPPRHGRLARNPYLWPFSSASVWNRPLGGGAEYSPIPCRPFLAEGPLRNAQRPRHPLLGTAQDPLWRLVVGGEARGAIRLAEANLPRAKMRDPLVVLQRARRHAFELGGVTTRADGGLEAEDMAWMALNGPGVADQTGPATPFGLSNLGGLLRVGELESGIRHALSARVSRDRLAGGEFARPATVWPARGNPAARGEAQGLRVGSLLAIPPDVDIDALFGAEGPGRELAAALRDYGVYITGHTDMPFALMVDRGGLPGTDNFLATLAPLLRLVANNQPETPGGGGVPRRELAPPLPGESR